MLGSLFFIGKTMIKEAAISDAPKQTTTRTFTRTIIPATEQEWHTVSYMLNNQKFSLILPKSWQIVSEELTEDIPRITLVYYEKGRAYTFSINPKHSKEYYHDPTIFSTASVRTYQGKSYYLKTLYEQNKPFEISAVLEQANPSVDLLQILTMELPVQRNDYYRELFYTIMSSVTF